MWSRNFYVKNWRIREICRRPTDRRGGNFSIGMFYIWRMHPIVGADPCVCPNNGEQPKGFTRQRLWTQLCCIEPWTQLCCLRGSLRLKSFKNLFQNLSKLLYNWSFASSTSHGISLACRQFVKGNSSLLGNPSGADDSYPQNWIILHCFHLGFVFLFDACARKK